MANNRMYLRCPHCGEQFMVAKYYPTITNGWYQNVGVDMDSLTESQEERDAARRRLIVERHIALDGFLQKHSFCNQSDGDFSLGNRSFLLVYEVPTESPRTPSSER